MSEDERGPDPGEVFRPLKSRPTPELDSEDLWLRTAAGLTERPGRLPWWRRPWSSGRPGEGATVPASGLAWGTLAAAALVLTVGIGVGIGLYRGLPGPAGPDPGATGDSVAGRDAATGDEDDAADRMVLLGSADGAPGADPDAVDPAGDVATAGEPPSTDELPAAGEPAATVEPPATGELAAADSPATEDAPVADASRPDGTATGSDAAGLEGDLRLRVRLIRGYDGDPPADVRGPDLQGAGGADELADLRAQIGGLLSYRSYGLTGRWQGTVGEELQRGIALGPGAVMHVAALTVAREDGTLSVDLVGLHLNVDGKELTTPRLRLVPGRVYLLGLPDEREPRGPSRVLAVQAELPDEPRRP